MEKEINKIEYIEELLNKGLSLIDILCVFDSAELGELPRFGGKGEGEMWYADLNKDIYNNYYFDEDSEGQNFYSLRYMPRYIGASAGTRLPLNGIITRDGRIYRADNLHMETAFWLKYNGIDLEKSLRFTYFIDTNRLEIRDCYDYVPIQCNNPDELFSIWRVRHDENLYARDLRPTEDQIKAIYFLKNAISNRYRKKLDFEKIFEENDGFRMNPESLDTYTERQRQIGEDNNDTINRALKELFSKKDDVVWG